MKTKRRINIRLTPALERIVTSYDADACTIGRAAIARLVSSPLTPAELAEAALPLGAASYSPRRQKQAAAVARAGKVPRN